MLMQRRALYNLLQLPHQESAIIETLEPWQIEDYRSVDDQTLFEALAKFGIKIPSIEGLNQFTHDFESPDDMIEALASELDEKQQDRLYLNLFELWRRHLPEKRCPSVFCDELDYQIRRFAQNPDEAAEDLEEILSYFMQILEAHLDEGADPQELFATFQTYCATSLEAFLFQYILREIESGEYDYAYDLIEGFFPYLSEPLWFNYLLARAQMLQEPKEGTEVLAQVIDHLDSLQLGEEMLLYLAKERNHPLFCKLSLKILELIQTEEEFQEFLECARLHFKQMELKEPVSVLEDLIESRQSKELEKPLSKSDKGFKIVSSLIEKWNHTL